MRELNIQSQAWALTSYLSCSKEKILLFSAFKVSKKELFQTDMTALLALCEKTENDIRSCLNTLQVCHLSDCFYHVFIN